MRTRTLTILVIDDDPTDIVLLQRHVDRIDGWSVKLVARQDTVEGLTALADEEFDVILLDYVLGFETGLTALQAIRASGHDGPVIFLTGQGDARVAVDAIQGGASDYLAKAELSPSSLKRSISNAVERARLQRVIDLHQANLKTKNTDLERRNREINAFYHTLSHELKTPLTSIRSFLEIVLEGLAGDVNEQQREYLGVALESAHRMTRCIDDLVDVTRLETGKVRLERRATDPAELCRSIVVSHQAQAEELGVELHAELEADLDPIALDPERIGQVLSNLLGNALKFTPPGGRITLRTTGAEPGGVRFDVVDTGRGIPADQVERIFERLHQVKEDDFSTAGGLGLGLNISRELVELHGGRISVASAEGAGSTFTVLLPRATEGTAEGDAGSVATEVLAR